MRRAYLYSLSFPLLCFMGCGGAEFTTGAGGGSSGTASTVATTSATGGASSTATSTTSTTTVATTTTGGGGSSVATSTTTSTGSSMGSEDCTNGVDDNNDGKIDCEDPLCTVGFTCVEKPPAGWGPVEFVSKISAAILPLCDPGFGGMTVKGDTGMLTANPATCSICTCGALAGDTCGIPSFTISSSQCGNAGATVTVSQPNTCTNPPAGLPIPGSITVGKVPVIGGSCPPSLEVPDVPVKFWSDKAELCSPDAVGAGCSDSQVCAPKPSSKFGSSVCIAQSGDVACPAGPKQAKVTIYATTTDTRGCSACSCVPDSPGTPGAATCSGEGSFFFAGSICNVNASGVVIKAGNCSTFQVPAAVSGYDFVPDPAGPSDGQCTANTSVPTGSAAGATPVTICCQG